MTTHYRWMIVAAGGILGCVAIGAMFSLPVFLGSISRDTGWSVTGVSSAMTIGFLAMAFTSMIWGTLSDRLGPLPVVLTGSVVLAASLGLASLATSLVAFQFIFGLMVGGSIAAIFASSTSIILPRMTWNQERSEITTTAVRPNYRAATIRLQSCLPVSARFPCLIRATDSSSPMVFMGI